MTGRFASGSFLIGANLPWVDYGCDFGASAWFPEGGLGGRASARARLEAAMARLAADRVRVVRLFVLCDGRSGIRTDAGGVPAGLDDAFFRDFDAVLDVAAPHGIGLMPVLFDFHLCFAPREVSGVVLGGRSAWLAGPEHAEALISRVAGPIAARYATHPGIAAWDLFNEPEWCVRRFGQRRAAARLVSFSRMREFLGELVSEVRREARQPVTVGSAGIRSLDLVRDLALDFYQVHWYEHFPWTELVRPVASLGLDRPVVLGEFPGRTEASPPQAILDAARAAGYAGAFVWSALSRDEASGYDSGRPMDV